MTRQCMPFGLLLIEPRVNIDAHFASSSEGDNYDKPTPLELILLLSWLSQRSSLFCQVSFCVLLLVDLVLDNPVYIC